jgi:Na+/alanine symporter
MASSSVKDQREEVATIGTYTPPQSAKRNAITAIAVGGLVAGTLDLTQALILFGVRVPLVIAAGLLGRQAISGGGPGTYVLGVLLHFFIATSVAAIYYTASRRLTFLKEHWLVCGLFYGMAVELVMNLVVLPLSALHSRGPYKLRNLIMGLVVHMVVIGLPVSFSIRRFAK